MTKLDDETGRWLRRLGPPLEDRPRLICFPHAGGSANYFTPLATELGGSVEVLGVQYPGRQDRHTERLIDNLLDLADMIDAALRRMGDSSDRRPALFGHSMGAIVAFEVARRMADTAVGPPVSLMVSGRRAPSIHRDDNVHRRSDTALVAEIEKLSGTSTGLLADEEVRQMVLPAIRADYKATETYRFRPGPILRTSISAFIGDSDPRVSIDEVEAWAEHTAAAFQCRVFPGGHFYLNEQCSAVAKAISEALTAGPEADAANGVKESYPR
ncbi:alpha/beta fold hydrolase [Spirillospora sp. NBC_00431]